MIKRVFVASLIALLLMSTFALAAGSSTSGARTVVPAVRANATVITTCEDKESVEGRIKCRFENKEVAVREAVDAVEEACRSSADEKKEKCRQFYKNSAKCFNSANPVEKKRCFLKESGININAGGTFRAAPDETKRNYVVLLLYELQEKIEAKQEQGIITTDQATSLVTKIVEIKKLILSGAKRSDIVPKIQEFKKEFREVMTSSEVS